MRSREAGWAAHGGMQDGDILGLIHMAHLPPLCQGSSRGSSWRKPRVAAARNACRGAAPPRSQNNRGQNRRHEAKSHREGLLRLSRTSDAHGRSGARQHLASVPAAGMAPQHPHIP